MLEIRRLQSGYASLTVLRGVSLSVKKGSVVALLGGNGAGKSTTMKTIVGVIRATAGEIELAGERIEPAAIARDLRARPRAGAAGPRAVSRDDRRGEPGARRAREPHDGCGAGSRR